MSASKLDIYYLIDLDRTLFDSMKSALIMSRAVAAFDGELGKALASQLDDYERRGETFSVQGFLEERVEPNELIHIRKAFLERAKEEGVRLPGATELLQFVHSQNDSGYGILTFGSVEGQEMKLAAASLDEVPYMVTDQILKGQLIRQWRQADGTYKLPKELGGQVAGQLVFIDDKPFSFQDIPEDVRCYWVKSVHEKGASELGKNVRPVKDLFAIIEAERLIDKA